MTRQEWARALIRRAADAPAYGSPEWLALPDGPAKVAAVVRAAECWATEGEDFAVRLAAELEALRRSDKAAEDAEYVECRDAHRREWERRDYRPHPANLRRATTEGGASWEDEPTHLAS